MRRIPKEIGIAFEQDVQMDPLDEGDLKLPHHDDSQQGGTDSEADAPSPMRDCKVPAGDLEFQAV